MSVELTAYTRQLQKQLKKERLRNEILLHALVILSVACVTLV